MRAALRTRIDKLEHHAKRQAWPQLVVCFQGEALPPGIREQDLVLWLHRPWCDQVDHTGLCEEREQGCVQE